MLLHFEKENFRNILIETARYFGVKTTHIEKDYFVSLVSKSNSKK